MSFYHRNFRINLHFFGLTGKYLKTHKKAMMYQCIFSFQDGSVKTIRQTAMKCNKRNIARSIWNWSSVLFGSNKPDKWLHLCYIFRKMHLFSTFWNWSSIPFRIQFPGKGKSEINTLDPVLYNWIKLRQRNSGTCDLFWLDVLGVVTLWGRRVLGLHESL